MPHNSSKLDAGSDPYVVGGVGNRILPEDTREIERVIDAAWQQIASGAGIATSDLLLVVSVAEGADRLLIGSASSLGIPYECVLPCSPDCFSEDFASRESVDKFERLLGKSVAVTVPEIEPLDKSRGYLWVNKYILTRADLLLAVWDGEPGNGPAGTAHTVDLATGSDLPVLWIPTHPPIEPVRLDLVPC